MDPRMPLLFAKPQTASDKLSEGSLNRAVEGLPDELGWIDKRDGDQ